MRVSGRIWRGVYVVGTLAIVGWIFFGASWSLFDYIIGGPFERMVIGAIVWAVCLGLPALGLTALEVRHERRQERSVGV